MSRGVNTDQHVDITLRAEILAQNRPKHCELDNAPAFAEFFDCLTGKGEPFAHHKKIIARSTFTEFIRQPFCGDVRRPLRSISKTEQVCHNHWLIWEI
jgi:hypothetical protein